MNEYDERKKEEKKEGIGTLQNESILQSLWALEVLSVYQSQ